MMQPQLSSQSVETLLPPTKALIVLLLKVTENVSDIFLSPIRPAEVRANGRIIPANISGVPALLPEENETAALLAQSEAPRSDRDNRIRQSSSYFKQISS